MHADKLSDGSVVIHNYQSFCDVGQIVYIEDSVSRNGYIVMEMLPNGYAILESFQMTSKDTAIHDTSVKPKNYRSTYNSKHGRVW